MAIQEKNILIAEWLGWLLDENIKDSYILPDGIYYNQLFTLCYKTI